MSGATQQILLRKLQDAIVNTDKILKAEPAVNSHLEDWQAWKEMAEKAEAMLKQRLTGVNSRMMSDTDNENVSRIRREMAKAKQNFENAKWIGDGARPPSFASGASASAPVPATAPALAPVSVPTAATTLASVPTLIAKKEPSYEGNLGSSFHPLSSVSAPTSLSGEKKLPNPITFNPPCEACRSDGVTCMRVYIRRGRVRCDRCVENGFRCSFPSGKSQVQGAQTIIVVDPEAPRPQRKRTIPFNDESPESPVGKRTKPKVVHNLDEDSPDIFSSTTQSSSSRTAVDSKHGILPNGISLTTADRKALIKIVRRERDAAVRKATQVIDDSFDRIIEDIEQSSS